MVYTIKPVLSTGTAKWLQRPTVLLAVLALSGCMSLAPNYEAPPSPIPAQWPVDTKSDQNLNASVAASLPWQSYFTDPQLQQLIQVALENNRDLRLAILRMEEAQAAFRIQRADQLPTVNVGGQGARGRVPADLSPTGRSRVGSEYRAEVGFNSWEIDLWGRVRNLKDAALQRWLATEAAQQAVRVALISQVADGYFQLRGLDEREALAQRTVETREKSYRIFKRRYEEGATSRLDLTQVETLLHQAQALHVSLQQARAAQWHALYQLVGTDISLPESLPPLDTKNAMVALTPGLPSDLLLNRPDVMAAEHQLRAANADIGAARAAFLPRIALTSSLGTASAELDDLFSSGSRAWTFVPVISLPIFDTGRRQANLDIAEVRHSMQVAEYEKTIQTAFREVSDALSAQYWLSEQLIIQRKAEQAQAERARLAQLRYDNGSAAYLEVLDAERDLLAAGQQLVQVRYELLASQVGLYAALGGGTQQSKEEAKAVPASENVASQRE
ncbi:efflux transporter outer membrane subunit [Alcaligenaceae bacterium 429]|uniref:efflux transporter outer membrane subunit n=1 Tax=Paenalcaligenes sp. Me52 TaxID=3392038 RepID=UPI001092AF0D|nr:efflux transporter outer membrane subunit [Alcaligenaceae bacterium 429]